MLATHCILAKLSNTNTESVEGERAENAIIRTFCGELSYIAVGRSLSLFSITLDDKRDTIHDFHALVVALLTRSESTKHIVTVWSNNIHLTEQHTRDSNRPVAHWYKTGFKIVLLATVK